MKILLSSLISLCLLKTLLFGQSSERPQTIVIPISSIGEVSETRKQILQNTLTQELSKHFQILPQDQFERVQEKVFEELEYDECTEDQCIIRIQEVLQIENVFNLQVIGEEGDTQLNLKWMNLDEKKNVTDFCENCKTNNLIKSTIVIVNKLLENKNRQDDVNRNGQNIYQGILYKRFLNKKWVWSKDGFEQEDIKYVGEIKNNLPNGKGVYTLNDGHRYEGYFLKGIWEGQGTFTSIDGKRKVGEWKNQKPWNVIHYNKNGEIIGEFKEGEYKWRR